MARKLLFNSPKRWAFNGLHVLLWVAAILVPPGFTMTTWVVLGLAVGVSLAWSADRQLTEWLHQRRGKPLSFSGFLSDRGAPLLLTLSAVGLGAFVLAWWNVLAGAMPPQVALWIFLGLAAPAMMAFAIYAFRFETQVYLFRREMPRPALTRLLSRACAFGMQPGLYMKPLAITGLYFGFWLGLLWVVAGGYYFAAHHFWGASLDPFRWDGLGDYTVLGYLVVLSLSFFFLTTWRLSNLRLVNLIHRQGRLRKGQLRHEIDTAAGTLGFTPTLATGAFFWLACGVMMLGGYNMGYWVREWFGLGEMTAMIVGLALGAVGFWVIVLFPAQWAMPLLAQHDCGWVRAIEASTRLVAIERGRAFGVALIANLLGLSLLGRPAGHLFKLLSLEGLDPLLALLLKEKTPVEARAAWAELREAEEFEEEDGGGGGRPPASRRPAQLERGFDLLLHQGRYLDALNVFQMFRRDHPRDSDALHGETLALLHMGNIFAAQERLERWRTAHPGDARAERLMDDIAAGRWDEDGPLYREAQRRNSQPVGRGI
ncbi:MAG: tetratricopeptide repeat protein [Sumerlaeia bacterium]